MNQWRIRKCVRTIAEFFPTKFAILVVAPVTASLTSWRVVRSNCQNFFNLIVDFEVLFVTQRLEQHELVIG